MCCCCNCSNLSKKVWSFVGVVIIFGFAAFFGFGLPAIVDAVARTEFIMEPGSQVYENWIDGQVPMYFDIYFWDWTNSEEATNENVRPNFVQRGPYVFLERHERHFIERNADHTITFKQNRTWIYIPEQSNGDFYTDRVTTPQTILMTVGAVVQDDPFLLMIMDGLITANNLLDGVTYENVLVQDVLFNGVEDPLLEWLNGIAEWQPELIEGIEVPPWDGFAYFAERNNSVEYDGVFRMGTGTDIWSNTGLMVTWNGEPNVPYYRGECGKVHGSTGQVNPPMTSSQIENPEDFILFVTDLCSAIRLKYDGDFELDGIQGSVWIGDNRVFDNGNTFPETECQCTAPVEECPVLKPGLFDVSECNFGAPLLVSFPHFYLADPSYLNAVTGLTPTRQLHEFRYALHPFSGIPLTVNGRLQYNVHVKDYGLQITNGLPDMVLPAFWVEQRVVLTQEKIDELKLIYTLRDVGKYLGWALFGVGCLAFIVAFYFSVAVWKD
ncbi:protein croquemort-like isoform X1 [Wyeomyia smithii]|uniref:protein croquemort-like isoform X1 n=2 Tax=Wyeomyia smithii TaxID=174621 RepID=UPI00246820E2|nr:protein croquemort-like isoform X1 [Wyeomyia smithii]XP_055548372.1 protein croquemort-like isoform X1 [Wyeomyia smithii]